MALAQGDKIGVYEILAPISGRGMCEAYKALEAGHFIPGQSVPITEFLECPPAQAKRRLTRVRTISLALSRSVYRSRPDGLRVTESSRNPQLAAGLFDLDDRD